ncbi:hypothetical protein AAHH80_41415, partial [Burkholderia pseudomallei]
AAIEARCDAAAIAPHAVDAGPIVVPNYSKTHVESELAKSATGDAQPSVLPMFGLLSGFMHGCLEVGAKPLVFIHA